MQEQINELTVQNSELRMAVATQVEMTVNEDHDQDDKDASRRSDLVGKFCLFVCYLATAVMLESMDVILELCSSVGYHVFNISLNMDYFQKHNSRS